MYSKFGPEFDGRAEEEWTNVGERRGSETDPKYNTSKILFYILWKRYGFFSSSGEYLNLSIPKSK